MGLLWELQAPSNRLLAWFNLHKERLLVRAFLRARDAKQFNLLVVTWSSASKYSLIGWFLFVKIQAQASTNHTTQTLHGTDLCSVMSSL